MDKIRELAESKQQQLIAQQNDGSFKIERKIEIVKINLNKIYEQFNKVYHLLFSESKRAAINENSSIIMPKEKFPSGILLLHKIPPLLS